MQQGSTFYPAAFICLVINILRPSPVLPFTVHTCKVRTGIRRNTIIVLHVDRIMRTARLIYSMLILAVQHVLACVNAHVPLLGWFIGVLLKDLHANFKRIIAAQGGDSSLLGQAVIVFSCTAMCSQTVSGLKRIICAVDLLSRSIITSTILPPAISKALKVIHVF